MAGCKATTVIEANRRGFGRPATSEFGTLRRAPEKGQVPGTDEPMLRTRAVSFATRNGPAAAWTRYFIGYRRTPAAFLRAAVR